MLFTGLPRGETRDVTGGPFPAEWRMGSGCFKSQQLITRDGKKRTLAIRRYQFAGDRYPLEDLPGQE